jgi:hypothetical protein
MGCAPSNQEAAAPAAYQRRSICSQVGLLDPGSRVSRGLAAHRGTWKHCRACGAYGIREEHRTSNLKGGLESLSSSGPLNGRFAPAELLLERRGLFFVERELLA